MKVKTKKHKNILVTGSIAYDRIMNFPGYFKNNIMPNHINNLNISFFIDKFQESFGGTAGNIAYNLSLLKINPLIWSNVGEKDFHNYQKWFQKNKINLSLIKKIKKEPTASAYIITDQDDNQIAGFYPGAMKKEITAQKINLKNIDLAIISAQNPKDMIKLASLFRREKIDFIFDPGQQVSSLSGKDLEKALNKSQVLIGNEYEINLICQKTKLSLKQLLQKTKTIIATMGPAGSIIYNFDQQYKIEAARPQNSSNPTGAGDAYRAGLIKGLIENWSWDKIGRFSGLLAVYTVEKYGTQTHKFSWLGLEKRYRQNFSEKL